MSNMSLSKQQPPGVPVSCPLTWVHDDPLFVVLHYVTCYHGACKKSVLTIILILSNCSCPRSTSQEFANNKRYFQ